MNRQSTKMKQLNLKGGDWYAIGKLVAETTKKKDWKPGQVALVDWLSRASAETGLSLNTIGRMLSVYEFINKIVPDKINQASAKRYPFSSLEILARIHAIAPKQTPSLLNSIFNKEITMRELRLKLKTLQSKQPEAYTFRRSASIRKYIEFEKHALYALHQSLSEFNCPRHYKFSELTDRGKKEALAINVNPPDALAFDREAIDITSIGFKIYHAGNENLNRFVHNKYRIIADGCYLSGFLCKLFLVFPASADQNIVLEIANTFVHAKRYNIGVALLRPFVKDRSQIGEGDTDNFIFLSKPLYDKEPTPDCRRMVDWNTIFP